MTKRVLYVVQDGRVLQWQDTAGGAYGDPADGMAIADISEGEWLRQDTHTWFWEDALTDVEPVVVYPPPTPEQIIERNFAVQQRLMAEASAAIIPLQYAVDLELEREAEAEQLKVWKRYVVEVSRVDLAQIEPDWPVQPESDPARLGGLFYGR